MKSDNLSDIRFKLWHSVEMSHVRLQLIVYAAMYIFLVGIAAIDDDRAILLPIMAVVMGLCILPFVVFWLVRIWRIFRSAEEYVFCRTELSQPHHAPLGHGLFSFMGIIETEEHGRFAVETHAIFQSGGSHLLMEDYLGSTVTLAWNAETEMVVVIG